MERRGPKETDTSVWFLYALAFIGQLVSGIVGLAVPIYAYLHGASPFLLGLIGASGGITYSIMPVIFGVISDWLRKKRLLLLSTVLYSLPSVLYMTVENPALLIPVRVLEWALMSSFWPPLEALIVEAVSKPVSEALKKFNIAWGSALILSPLVGGSLISSFSVEAPFMVSLIVSLLTGLLIILLVKEPANSVPEEASIKRAGETGEVHGGYDALFFMAVSTALLLSFISGTILSLFPAFAYTLGIPADEIGLIMLFLGLSRIAAFHQAVKIEARLGMIRVFMLSCVVFTVASVMMANSYTSLLFSLCFIAFGFGAGLSYATCLSFIVGEWGSSRGKAAGIFESILGFGYFTGSFVSGALSEVTPATSYLFIAILSMSVLAIHLILSKKVS